MSIIVIICDAPDIVIDNVLCICDIYSTCVHPSERDGHTSPSSYFDFFFGFDLVQGFKNWFYCHDSICKVVRSYLLLPTPFWPCILTCKKWIYNYLFLLSYLLSMCIIYLSVYLHYHVQNTMFSINQFGKICSSSRNEFLLVIKDHIYDAKC